MNEEQALAWAFNELPIGRLTELLGASRSTICRMRASLKAVSDQSQSSVKPVPNRTQPAEGDLCSIDPPHPLKGVSPQGESNSPTRGKPKKIPCPEDWQPRPKDRDYAQSLGVDPQQARDEMVDWSNGDRTKNRKSDWDATYRNWVRREGKRIAQEREKQARIDARFNRAPQDRLTDVDRQHVAKLEREKQARERRLARSREAWAKAGGDR